jgi:dynein light chain LC8-type
MSSKAVVKLADMPKDMLDYAITQASIAQETLSGDKEVAHRLKTLFNENFKPNWHCLIGRHFSSYVGHEANAFCYFYLGQMAVLLWKTPQ